MGRVVVVGSLNIDLVTHVERHPKSGETVRGAGLELLAGGKGANQAVAASAAGAPVAMVGCVGSDEVGAAYIARLLARGIDVAAIRVVPSCPTGHELVVVDDAGETTIISVAGANAAVTVDDLGVLDAVGPGDIVMLQLEVSLEVVTAAARRAAAKGARIVLNMAPYAVLPPGRGLAGDGDLRLGSHDFLGTGLRRCRGGLGWRSGERAGGRGLGCARYHRRRRRLLWLPVRSAGCRGRPSAGVDGRPGWGRRRSDSRGGAARSRPVRHSP